MQSDVRQYLLIYTDIFVKRPPIKSCRMPEHVYTVFTVIVFDAIVK